MTQHSIDSNLPQPKRPLSEQPLRKASFDNIYNAPDPGPYFSTLRPLDYRTPQFAQPVIRRTISELRRSRGRDRITVLDLCSGYGVNGALMKYDISLDDLYRIYAAGAKRTANEDRAALATRRRGDDQLQVIGQDVAGRALCYAKEAGFVDETLLANLETDDLTEVQEDLIANTDLVTITGGLSYVGEATLIRVFSALHRPPWVLLFPIRGTDTDPINETLCLAGLRPECWHKPLPQRRFADDRERRNVHATVERSTDGLGPVSPTHHQAILYLARPAGETGSIPMSSLVTGLATPLARAG